MDVLTKENHRLNDILQEKINEIERLQIKLNNLDNKLSDKSNEVLRVKAEVDEKEQELN